jgi:CheY-like chemotaxis protein
MPLLLILENNPTDLRKAADFAKRAGFDELEVYRHASEATAYLQKGLAGRVPLPHAMVVDLDLGMEGGFELVRYWHSSPKLKSIPVLVWSILGNDQKAICRPFGVSQFVSKQDDPNVLRAALAEIIAGRSNGQMHPA